MDRTDITLFDPEKLQSDEEEVRVGFWPKIRRTLGLVPFSDQALAAFYCATDRNTPLSAKATLLGALAYFILPADVIPDMLVGLGYTDDLAVLLAAVKAVGDHLRPEHLSRAREALRQEQAESKAGDPPAA